MPDKNEHSHTYPHTFIKKNQNWLEISAGKKKKCFAASFPTFKSKMKLPKPIYLKIKSKKVK